MSRHRVERAPAIVCALDTATVTVDYTNGRTGATLSRARPQSPVTPGPRWRPSWGSQELGYGWHPSPRPTTVHLLLAAPALALTLLVLCCGRKNRTMSRALWLLRQALRVRTREATPAEAERVHRAVRWIGLFLPVRVACLEESVATVLALAPLGRHVTWCHGVCADPIEFHAWLRTSEGDLIAEPASTQRFQTLLTVAPHPREQEENTHE